VTAHDIHPTQPANAFFTQLPIATWFFIGVEIIPLASQSTTNVSLKEFSFFFFIFFFFSKE
jgi:hypothetical protein